MKKLREIDWKYTLITVLVMALTWQIYEYWDIILLFIKNVLLIENLSIILGAFSAILLVIVKIKERKLTFHSKMSFSDFRIPFEDLTSSISNPITLAFSVSLLKGLFLDFVNDESLYFPLFNGVEVTFLWILMFYLLYLSIMDLISNFNIIRKKIQLTDNPTGLPEEKTEGRTVPLPEEDMDFNGGE